MIYCMYMTCALQLAHDAFKVAQSLDPAFISCWIGQVTMYYLYCMYYLYLIYSFYVIYHMH